MGITLMSRYGIIKDCACKRARHRHGTYGAYTVDRCRCDDCREAARLYRKRTKLAAANGRSNRIPCDRAVAHLRLLTANGWNPHQIAIASGIAPTTIVHMLARGRYTLRRTEQAILSIPAHTRPASGYIDPTGTRRRVHALTALGWPQAWIARRLGIEESSLRQTMAAGIVQATTADAIAALYDQMWAELPPTRTLTERRFVATARNLAARNGWAPPLAWDNIDNPKEKPRGVSRDDSRQAGFADIEEMVAAGESVASIAHRLDVKPGAIYNRCRRAGRLDLWQKLREAA